MSSSAPTFEQTGTLGVPSIAVVMSTYGRRQALPRVLPALLAQAADEFVLVVNGSHDGSLEYLQEQTADDPRVRLLFLENEGLTNAQWVAAQEATSDVVLFVDDDVRLSPGLVRGHARRHAEQEGRVVVGFMPTEVPATLGPRSFTTVLYAQEYLGVVDRWVQNPETVLSSLWMGNVSFRREDYLSLRAHLEAPGLRYHQDKHLGLAAQRAGLSAVFDRELLAHHVHERSLEAFLEQARRQGGDQHLLHRLHPQVLGPYDADRYADGLSPALRLLVRVSTVPSVHGPVVAMLSAAVKGAGRVARYPLQTNIARLLRRIETQFGAASAPQR